MLKAFRYFLTPLIITVSRFVKVQERKSFLKIFSDGVEESSRVGKAPSVLLRRMQLAQLLSLVTTVIDRNVNVVMSRFLGIINCYYPPHFFFSLYSSSIYIYYYNNYCIIIIIIIIIIF